LEYSRGRELLTTDTEPVKRAGLMSGRRRRRRKKENLNKHA
jgi:hypothetical protein